MMMSANTTVNAVEEILWSEENACYMDILRDNYIQEHRQQEQYSISITRSSNTILTQDVSLYLVAITENITENTKDNTNFNNCLLYSKNRMTDGTGNNNENYPTYQVIKTLQRAAKDTGHSKN